MTVIEPDCPPGLPASLSRAELRGRAAATSLLAFFGLAWTGCGISAIPTATGAAVFAVAALASVILVGLAVRMGRRATTAPAGDDPAQGSATGLRFGLIVAAELIGIFVIAHVLTSTGHPHFIPSAIAFAVGVHFFALGRLYRFSAYHLTGAALCLAAAGTAVLAPLTGITALWTALPGFGSALALYATCGYLLRSRTAR
jgi:hypothetical protein